MILDSNFKPEILKEPTTEMWDNDLTRSIVRWMGEVRPHSNSLRHELKMRGIEVPEWLDKEAEMNDGTHVISKGTRAVILYKSMVNAKEET